VLKIKKKIRENFCDRRGSKVDYPIIAPDKQGFLLLGENGEIYKAGADPDSNIIPKRITGEVKNPAVVQVEMISFLDEDLRKLSNFADKQAYLTGSVSVDDPESVIVSPHPREWNAIALSGATVTLKNAPIAQVIQALNDQYLTGSINVRTIYVQ